MHSQKKEGKNVLIFNLTIKIKARNLDGINGGAE